MPKIARGILLFLLALAGCRDSTTEVPNTTPLVIVRSGISFGECLGYCHTELTVPGVDVVLVRKGYRGEPEIRVETRIPAAQWLELVRGIDLQALVALPDVLGCPDCADGGAEWIEVEVDGTIERVTFEYGDDVPEIQALLTAAREIRNSLRRSP